MPECCATFSSSAAITQDIGHSSYQCQYKSEIFGRRKGELPLENSVVDFELIMLPNPIELEIFKNIYHSIAEEMGAALRRTAFSPNIKERRDYSCAVFDAAGSVIAMGDHMPVHLGSMPMSVRAAIDEWFLTRRRRDAERSVSRRNSSPRHHFGRACVLPVRASSTRAHAEQNDAAVLISTLLRARIMPMSAAPIPVPWDLAARSIRKACAFHR